MNGFFKNQGYTMPTPIDPRFNVFYLLTGVTFVTFASGFGVCLFNLDTVDACVEMANSWVGVFKGMGDHLIAWAFALAEAAFNLAGR